MCPLRCSGDIQEQKQFGEGEIPELALSKSRNIHSAGLALRSEHCTMNKLWLTFDQWLIFQLFGEEVLIPVCWKNPNTLLENAFSNVAFWRVGWGKK